ncbi:9ca626e6-3fb9-424e-9e86-49e20ff67985 [Sclerotinia trifoliorum]|uniref:non-specific serine/threonine protein kinase n=1 Tax=Sclerotinia trifoliorum TaxID=28548 RepID=A0A8H2W1H3_9HELO|nr:9ca626e6-3fb9-424e-9e86-49e20ff67985 [Sclerotinia trifoliorum]
MAITSWDLREAESRLVDYHRSLSKTPKTIRRNKWRPDPEFGGLEDQVFEGILGVGAFGSVYRVLNQKNQKYYALKIQSETAEQRHSRQKRTAAPSTSSSDDDTLAYTYTPPLTPSSEASIHSIRETSIRNLISKRHRENRCYLQYIKSGHPNICALEAFLDFTSEMDPHEKGLVILASYYEYCDGGTLQEIIERYGDGYKKSARIVEENRQADLFNRLTLLPKSRWQSIQEVPCRRHPPELFIWHIFTQLMGAIAFLHNEHPDYMDREEHRTRAMVMTADLSPANIFLKWNTEDLTQRRRTYPDVKVGDFGSANFLPKGGRLVGEERLDLVWSNPPESDAYDGKTDVWCVGAMVYMLGTQAKMCEYIEGKVRADETREWERKDERMEREARQRINPERVGELEGMYSSTLNKAVKAALRIERDKRPSSGAFCKQLQTSYGMRKLLMFRTLPEWALSGRKILKHEFPEGRIENLIAGEFEKEDAKYWEDEMKGVQAQERQLALMWVEKDRKLRFGLKLEEWEEGDDEDHAKYLEETIRDTPEFYKELLAEARISVPSP